MPQAWMQQDDNDRSGYCADHQNTGWESHQKGKSRHERGYGNDWTIRRARILTRDNRLCQECLRNGRAVAATTVDHIKAKGTWGPMTTRTLKACAGPATEGKQPRRDYDELPTLHILRLWAAYAR